MVNDILTLLDIPFRETVFKKAPKTTYGVYSDTFDARGADDVNLIREHDVSIEIYQYAPDPEVEMKLERILDERGIDYTKQARYWIESEQLYQVVYEFIYIEKGGVLNG